MIEGDPGVELLDEPHEVFARRWRRLGRRVPDRLRERRARANGSDERTDGIREALLHKDGRESPCAPVPHFPNDTRTDHGDDDAEQMRDDPADERGRPEEQDVLPAQGRQTRRSPRSQRKEITDRRPVGEVQPRTRAARRERRTHDDQRVQRSTPTSNSASGNDSPRDRSVWAIVGR